MDNDGGPAFPVAENQDVAANFPWTRGMTLRDYFAAKAMQGYFSNEVCPHRCAGQDVASYCYEMADAMLEARK